MLFDLADLGQHLDHPLTPKILSNPYHAITHHILYLYTMESFIYADMNKASRTKDPTKIKFYGAFAAALSYIIYNANKNKKINAEKKPKEIILFRGVKMHPAEVELYEVNDKTNLIGYTSTSQDYSKALKFAFSESQPDQIPVIF